MRRIGVFLAFVLSVPLLMASPPNRQPFQIKILSTNSEEVRGRPLVPMNCGLRDYDGYCNSALQNYVWKSMLVQEPGGQTVEVGCWMYADYSDCRDLPVHQTFTAIRKKHGLEIQYLDRRHKLRKQLYEFANDTEP